MVPFTLISTTLHARLVCCVVVELDNGMVSQTLTRLGIWRRLQSYLELIILNRGLIVKATNYAARRGPT